MSCDCKCFVVLPGGAVGWSAVCDGGIPWSDSLTSSLYLTESDSVVYNLR